MILVCHVIFQDHLIKVLCEFMGRIFITVSYHPTKFGGHRHFGSGDMFLVYHVISQDHVIKRLCDFMEESHL